MATGTDADLQERLVFARVGWCRLYNETPGDEPMRGGKWNINAIGSEFANFSVIRARVYGYVTVGDDGLFNALRVTGDDKGKLDDITVAVFATTPGGSGQVLVGWYRHADASKDGYPDRPGDAYGIYNWCCAAKNAVLLPTSRRRVKIPKGAGGAGQSNVTYVRDQQGRLRRDSWISNVRRFIASYDGPNLVGLGGLQSNETVVADEAEALLRGQNILQNAHMRDVIEDHAMRKVRAALRADGYDEIEDVHEWESFDFYCRKGRVWRMVEVKGTRTPGEALLFSDAEVNLAKTQRVDLYVVSGIKLACDDNGQWKASGGRVTSTTDWGSRNAHRKSMGWQVTFIAPSGRRSRALMTMG